MMVGTGMGPPDLKGIGAYGRARVPAQVLLAGNTIHDSSRGIDRVRALVPAWRYRLWPDATHMLPCEAVSDVVACIREFAGSAC